MRVVQLVIGLLWCHSVSGNDGCYEAVKTEKGKCEELVKQKMNELIKSNSEDISRVRDTMNTRMSVLEAELKTSGNRLFESQNEEKSLRVKLSEALAKVEATGDAKRDLKSLKEENSKLQSTVIEKTKEIDDIKIRLRRATLDGEGMTKTITGLRAEVAQLKANAENEKSNAIEKQERMKTSLAAKYESEIQKANAETEKVRKSVNTVVSKLENKLEDANSRVSDLRAKIDVLNANAESSKKQLAEESSVIYSVRSFGKNFNDIKRILFALTQVARKRVIDIVGLKHYDLAVNQAKSYIFVAKVAMKDLYMKMQANYFQPWIGDNLHAVKGLAVYTKIRELGETMEIQASMYRGRCRELLGAYFDRVIHNLSSVNPEIVELFPVSFEDRCFAFAFVVVHFTVLYSVLSRLLGMIFNRNRNTLAEKKKRGEKKKRTEVKLAKPVDGKLAKPVEGFLAKPVEGESAKPVERKSAKPVEGKSAKPVEGESVKPVEGKSAKPVEGKLAKPFEGKLAEPVFGK